MMTTILDRARADLLDQPDNDVAELRFYHALADAPLFLLLAVEAEDDRIEPRVFDLDDGPVILAFDTEERLASLGQGPVPYAVLPGRVVAAQLAGKGVALGLNLGCNVASEVLLPAEALVWLTQTLGQMPPQSEARPQQFHAPGQLPSALADALSLALGRSGDHAAAALISGVSYDDGRRGHMLAILDARPGAEEAFARAAAEALRFSGLEAGEMDVTFLDSQSEAARAMARVGLRLDLANAAAEVKAQAGAGMQASASAAPQGPGMNPQKPPILR
jgi:hypothetical protein